MFDRQRFSELLRKAQGGRSLNRFAADTGISAAHLSRLTRALLESAPAPPTIRKIADAAEGGVTYEALMRAAGHIESGGETSAESDPAIYGDIYDLLLQDEYQVLFELAKDATKEDLDIVIQMLRQLSKRNEPPRSEPEEL